jgi:cysteine-rich repeat protein
VLGRLRNGVVCALLCAASAACNPHLANLNRPGNPGAGSGPAADGGGALGLADAGLDASDQPTDAVSDAAANREADSASSARCGDGHVDADEACDDGNAETEACAYGLADCSVCDDTCHYTAGAVHSCGDGQTDRPDEACDDGNQVGESCAYGQHECSVCGPDCQNQAGATSFCGDGMIQDAHGEQCDDGNTSGGDGCDATCQVEHVVGCGNGVLDAGEQCDDNNTKNLDGCSAACKKENGWTCPETGACSEACGDKLVVGAEVCDDGNMVDGDYCSNDCRSAHRCGDHAVQSAANESCDDGNTILEACGYGKVSCSVCNASCKSQSGAVAYCGDGVVQAAQGEACEPSLDVRCGSDCKFACDEILISYSLASSFQITGTTFGLGDTSAAQPGGALIVAFKAGASGPVDGTGGITYLRSPIKLTQKISSTTIGTDIVGLAGTVDNQCPLQNQTLSGVNFTASACPYGSKHGGNDWTPVSQQVASPNGPGCLIYTSTGNISCSGAFCITAGLKSGDNAQDDTWDQPAATLVFSSGFANVQQRALGTPAAGSGQPSDKLEIPNNVTGRTWINFDGTETGRTCVKKPSDCSAPGAR